MAKLTAKKYDLGGKEKGELTLKEELFGVKWNPHVIRLALIRHMANERNTVAHTKTRGETVGSTKKVWAQKHTGRARHGDGKTNIWRGGGVTFGPRSDRNYTKRLPKKERRLAIFSMLSNIFSEGKVKFVEDPKLESPKTKVMGDAMRVLDLENKTLWVTGSEDRNSFLSIRNLENQTVIRPQSLNVKNLAFTKTIVVFESALDEIYNHFFGEKVEVIQEEE